MLHALSTSVPSPRQFTYPFCYDVDPLAEAASEELQHYIATTGLMSAEKGCGKMFGVLVVEYEDEEGALQRGFLAAYSGLLGGRNDWQYFVPPVFDAQQPDGHFKRTEREISAINREISAIEHDPQYLQSVAQHEETMKRLQAEVDAFKAEVDAAKVRRDARRKSGEPLSEEEQAEMIRESQFMKAELRRRRKAMEQAESTFHNPHATLLKSLPASAQADERRAAALALRGLSYAQRQGRGARPHRHLPRVHARHAPSRSRRLLCTEAPAIRLSAPPAPCLHGGVLVGRVAGVGDKTPSALLSGVSLEVSAHTHAHAQGAGRSPQSARAEAAHRRAARAVRGRVYPCG